MFLSGVLVIEINQWLTAMVSIGIMCATILTLVTKSICNIGNIRSQVTLKRVVILVVSVLVGAAFINSQNNVAYITYIDKVIPFTLMTLFFIILLVNLNSQKAEFFNWPNCLMVLLCAFII